jgi:hypothetical protein
MVELSKANIEPKWGLYNGALGTVVDIIFQEGENPNDGDLSLVVVVDFKHYRGPIWDKQHPTHVPIVLIKKGVNQVVVLRKKYLYT